MGARDILWAVVLAAELAAALLCLWRRTGGGRLSELLQPTLSATLCFAVLSDIAVAVGYSLILKGAPKPFCGVARAWYHAEGVLVLGWPALLSLAVQNAFARGEKARIGFSAIVSGAWIGISVGLALTYPSDRFFVQRALLFSELVAVVLAWAAIWQGWSRDWSRSTVHVCLVVLLCFESVVLLLGPFSHDVFRDWGLLARVPYGCAFLGVAGLLMRERMGGDYG